MFRDSIRRSAARYGSILRSATSRVSSARSGAASSVDALPVPFGDDLSDLPVRYDDERRASRGPSPPGRRGASRSRSTARRCPRRLIATVSTISRLPLRVRHLVEHLLQLPVRVLRARPIRFVDTKTSAISIRPAFAAWTASPQPGFSTTRVVSHASVISTSAWPTPTVSMIDDVVADGIEDPDGLGRGQRQAPEMSSRRHGTDEHALVGGVRPASERGRRAALRPRTGSTDRSPGPRPSCRPAVHARRVGRSAWTCPAPGAPVIPIE